MYVLVHESSSLEMNSCLRIWYVGLQTEWMCREEKSQLIFSQLGKMLTWNGSREILTHKHTNTEVCVWVCLRKRWRVRLSAFTDIVWDALGVTDRKRETVWPSHCVTMRPDTVCMHELEVLESASEYVNENPPTQHPCAWLLTHVCVSPDLVLRGELLHVSAETPEARQEVVDHHLLRNDCTGS